MPPLDRPHASLVIFSVLENMKGLDMPAFTPRLGPLTPAAQAVADSVSARFAGSPTRFYPSIERDPQEPYSAVIAQSSDLTWRKGRGKSRKGFGLWIRPRTTPTVKAVPTRIRENIAACAALGLSYWSEAPDHGALWALDTETVIHMVMITRHSNTAKHICGTDKALRYGDTRRRCTGTGENAEYAATPDDEGLWALADFRPTPGAFVGTVDTPAQRDQRKAVKLKIDQQLLLFVAAQIRETNSAITTLDAEILAALYSTRQYSSSLTLSVSVARDLMPLIEAEIKRRAEAANECATDMREAAIA